MHTKSGLVFGLTVVACAAACSQGDVSPPSASASAPAAAAAPKVAVDALPEGYVHVPNGVIAHQDCVHEIPNGARVDADGNVTLAGKLVAHYDACAHPIQLSRRPDGVVRGATASSSAPGPSNWIEATWVNAPANDEYVSSTTTFQVPQPPSKDNGQIVYLFPSIQTGGEIVQPVLQYGSYGGGTAGTGYNGSGGSVGSNSAWTYAAWGVTTTNAYHSTGITVNAGDTLEGQMVAWSQSTSGTTWEIVATDNTTGASTWEFVDFTGTGLWNNAQAAVLEAYGVTTCTDFPSTGFNKFAYPTLSQSTWGSPWGSKQTTVSPTSSIWTALSYSNGTLSSGYVGPSCGFGDLIATTANGTTLEY